MNELDFLSRRFMKLKPFRFRLRPGNEIKYNPIFFEGSNNVRRFHKGDEGQFRKLYLHRFSKIFRDKDRNKVIRPELSILPLNLFMLTLSLQATKKKINSKLEFSDQRWQRIWRGRASRHEEKRILQGEIIIPQYALIQWFWLNQLNRV